MQFSKTGEQCSSQTRIQTVDMLSCDAVHCVYGKLEYRNAIQSMIFCSDYVQASDNQHG